MPHTLDVQCPSCGKKAFFEFAETVRIRLKKDVSFFQENDQFEYLLCTDSCGHRWHAAIFYPGLHGGSIEAIRELPKEYSRTDFAHRKGWETRRKNRKGSVTCQHCHIHETHILSWPCEAYFQVEYRNDILWAFNEESALVLRDFIQSTDRKRNKEQWGSFLMKIPTKFLRQAAREKIVKRLNKLIVS